MINRIKIPLNQAEYNGLLQLAHKELRAPENQIRHLLREELARAGLLKDSDITQIPVATMAGHHD